MIQLHDVCSFMRVFGTKTHSNINTCSVSHLLYFASFNDFRMLTPLNGFRLICLISLKIFILHLQIFINELIFPDIMSPITKFKICGFQVIFLHTNKFFYPDDSSNPKHKIDSIKSGIVVYLG